MKKDLKHTIKIFSSTLLMLAIVVLVIYEMWDLIKGPQVIVNFPKNGELLLQSVIEVEGQVKNTSAVFLNGRKIFVTEEGEFKEKLLLMPGYNIMTITVEDRQKRRKEKRIEVMFDDRVAPDSL